MPDMCTDHTDNKAYGNHPSLTQPINCQFIGLIWFMNRLFAAPSERRGKFCSSLMRRPRKCKWRDRAIGPCARSAALCPRHGSAPRRGSDAAPVIPAGPRRESPPSAVRCDGRKPDRSSSYLRFTVAVGEDSSSEAAPRSTTKRIERIDQNRRATGVWNHFQYSGLIWSEFIRAGRRRFRRLGAGTRSCGPGPPVYDYRGRGTPSHRLGRIHPHVRSSTATGTDRKRSDWRT